MKLDDLLKDSLRGAPLPKEALDQIRAAARAELKSGSPVARWPKQLGMLLGATFGVVLLAGTVLLTSGSTTTQVIASHGIQVAMMVAVAAAAGLAALRPHAGGGWLAVGLAFAGAASLVLLRMEPVSPTLSPGWMCTVSHISAGLLPLCVALWILRGSAPSSKKALLAGIAAGSTGALLGEMACEKGPLHIATYHLSAWLIIVAAVVLVSRRLKPRSYAP